MTLCELCREPREEGDEGQNMNGDLYWAHRECLLRMALGGIGHQLDHGFWCVERGDPDGGKTFRESALAVDAWIRDLTVGGY